MKDYKVLVEKIIKLITLYIGDLKNIVPQSPARDNRICYLESELAALMPEKKSLQLGESETKGDLTQPDYLIKGDIA